MELKYLLDTNAVIELTGNKLPDAGAEWMESLVAKGEHCLSVITRIEMLGFNGEETEMNELELFSRISVVIPMTEQVVEKSIEVRKKYKIKLGDAIIAATALAYNLILVTRNTKDFEKIENLEMVNPHEQ